PGHEHVGNVVRADDHRLAQHTVDLGIPPAVPRRELDLLNGADIFRRRVKELDQVLLQRRADHRAAAEAHDREAGSHPAAVREPADQGADRRHVAETEPASADHAVAEIKEPELVGKNAQTAEQITAAPAARGHDAYG